jgi:hypothetical protein
LQGGLYASTLEELPYFLTLKGNPYRIEGERRYSCPRINPGVIHRKLLTGVSCTMHKTFPRKV